MCNTICPFKVHSSIVFSVFTEMSNHQCHFRRAVGWDTEQGAGLVHTLHPIGAWEDGYRLTAKVKAQGQWSSDSSMCENHLGAH